MKESSFWNHLDELRHVVMRILAIAMGAAMLFFFLMPQIFDRIILAPCNSDFVLYRAMCLVSQRVEWLPDLCNYDFSVELINVRLTSQFFIHMSSALYLGVIAVFPIVIYLLWGFISPALYDHEKRNAGFAFALGNIMFYIGIAVGYLLVFPLTLRFLADYQISTHIMNQISIDSYMGHFVSIIFIMGVVFELPLLCWLLSGVGLLRRSYFSQFRRHAIVAILVLAAVITPSGDPFTLMVVFVPIYALYELSALFVKKV